MIKKFTGKVLLAVAGWKLEMAVPPETLKRCVLVAAPHTSNWDFYYGIAVLMILDTPMKFFIKDSWTKPWYGFVIRAMGGIGIDRSRHANMTGQAVALFREHKTLCLVNTPEGTRAFAPKWKTGFYHIADQAGVPIVLGYIDASRKTIGIGKVIDHRAKTQEEVFLEIQHFYQDKRGLRPENFNPRIF